MLSGRAAAKWILRNTLVSSESLTPEIRLHLITEASPLWMSTPESCPLPDPYWAFYWPGGQALTRYILDHGHSFAGNRVLDFGCGCGSGGLAATLVGARSILFNDIDIYALVASRLNFRLNRLSPPSDAVSFSRENLLENSNHPRVTHFLQGEKSKLLLGDMFYDVDFTVMVFSWLRRLKVANPSLEVLIGDPDRHPLADRHLERRGVNWRRVPLAEYPLPAYITREHYGFTTAKVFRIEFDV